MSRRRRRRDREYASDISNDPLSRELRSPVIKRILEPPTRRTILDIEDRRLFSPELARPAQALQRMAARLVVKDHDPNVNRTHQKVRANQLHVPSNVRFSDPSRVAVCVRRHQRREVLHALKRVGRGSAPVRRARWSEFSDIKCK